MLGLCIHSVAHCGLVFGQLVRKVCHGLPPRIMLCVVR